MNETIWVTGSLLLLIFCLIPICLEDIRHRMILPTWNMVLGLGGILLSLVHSVTEASYNPLFLSVLGALSAAGLGLLCRLMSKDGFGLGDLKLMMALGAAMGLTPFLRGMVFTGVVSLIAALFLLLVKKAKSTDTLPFAPFLSLGAVLSELLEIVWKDG